MFSLYMTLWFDAKQEKGASKLVNRARRLLSSNCPKGELDKDHLQRFCWNVRVPLPAKDFRVAVVEGIELVQLIAHSPKINLDQNFQVFELDGEEFKMAGVTLLNAHVLPDL